MKTWRIKINKEKRVKLIGKKESSINVSNILLHCGHAHSGITVHSSPRFTLHESTTDKVGGCINIYLELCLEAMLPYLIWTEASLQAPKKELFFFFFKSGDKHLMINTNYPMINNTEMERLRRNDGGKILDQ